MDQRALFIQATRGRTLTVLFALLCYPDRSLGTAQLQAITGYSKNTVTAALHQLAELKAAQQQSRYTGWTATAHIRQTILGELPEAREAQTLDLEAREAQSLRLPPGSSNSSSSRDQGQEDLTTTHYSQPEAQKTRLSPESNQVRLALEDAGVFPGIAARLASDAWVTQDRVDRWLENLQAQAAEYPNPIRSLPALLAANLRSHREPPPRRRDWTEYLCPDCGASPCLCNWSAR